MTQPWEATLLLALMALVMADRALRVVPMLVVDGLVLVVGALVVGPYVDLSRPLVWFWLTVAAAAADQVVRVGGERSRHDPFGLLARTEASVPAYTLVSVVGAGAWTAALLIAGGLLGSLTHGWLLALVALLLCCLPRPPHERHLAPVATRRR